MARSFLYFAYGSNLHPARLAARTPSCHALGRAVLARHVLRFHKRGRDGSAKCDAWFTGDPTDRLYGVVYLSLINISEPTRPVGISRMPSSA